MYGKCIWNKAIKIKPMWKIELLGVYFKIEKNWYKYIVCVSIPKEMNSLFPNKKKEQTSHGKIYNLQSNKEKYI